MQVKINDATRDQLLYFMQVRLSLKNLRPNSGIDTLKAKIKEVWAEDFIEVEDHAPKGGNAGPQKDRGHYAAQPTGKVDPLRFGILDPMVNIKIHADKAKGGDRNVACHLNGVEYFIPRNRNVDIPYRYFQVLEEAVGDIHDGWDDKQRMNSDSRETQSYTYTVNRRPTDAEIDAWEAKLKPFLDKQRKQKMARINKTRTLRDDVEERANL